MNKEEALHQCGKVFRKQGEILKEMEDKKLELCRAIFSPTMKTYRVNACRRVVAIATELAEMAAQEEIITWDLPDMREY